MKSKLTLMSKEDFFNFMKKMEEPSYPNLRTRIIHMLELLWTVHWIVKESYLQEYLGIEEKELEETLNQIFSPVYLKRCFKYAIEHDLDLIQEHASLVNIIKRHHASYDSIRSYFTKFQFLPNIIMEFRGIYFNEYELRQWVSNEVKHPLKISNSELERIIEFNRKNLRGESMKEIILSLLDCISQFSDGKTITLEQMENFLGCSSSMLDEQLENIFARIKGEIRFYSYANVIYDYRRFSFMDKLTREQP